MKFTFPPNFAVVSLNARNCRKHDNDMIILSQIGDTSMKFATCWTKIRPNSPMRESISQHSFLDSSEERQAAEQTNNGTVLYIFVRYITTFFWERNQHQKCPSRFVKWISSVSAAGQVVVFFLRPFLSQRTLLCRTGLCFHYFSPQRPDSSLWSVP